MNNKNDQVDKKAILTVGSDTSFDLLIEVLPINKDKKINLEVYPLSIKSNSEKMFGLVISKIKEKIDHINYSFNIKIYNKVPDIFVWLGRFEGVVSKIKEYEQKTIIGE